MKVWKYKLVGRIEMPEGAVILKVSFDVVLHHPVIWALVDPEAEKEDRWFFVASTGVELPHPIADCPYIDSIIGLQKEAGETKFLATHVWEIPSYLVAGVYPDLV